MTEKTKTITVFGSSRPEDGHADYVEALELGRALAAAGFAVCTGGYGGVMEAVSRGARESGGRVLAVTSSFSARAPIAGWKRKRAWPPGRSACLNSCASATATSPARAGRARSWNSPSFGKCSTKSDGAAPVRRARRFLAADSGSRARSRARARIEMGRVERSAGASGAHSRGSRAVFGRATREWRAAWKGN